MITGKRNEFLDASGSEDEAENYNSDHDEITKGGRSAKRRKVDSNNRDSDDVSDDDDESGGEREQYNTLESAESRDAAKSPKKPLESDSGGLASINRVLTKKNLVASEAAVKKSGVVYISRIPPGMKPSALRSLLSRYGALNRIFLAPEDPAARARRKKAGGNKRVLFTEGWIEFVKKKEAKAACDLLNGRQIGGKKGSFFRDDIWNLVYLKGFKWQNLTEQITAENAERTSRMRAEISKSTRENKEFVRNVEKAKMLDGMQAKAEAKAKAKATAAANANGDNDASVAGSKGRGRSFTQVQQVKKPTDTQEQPEHVTRVLSKIF